jgi:hypothetical protein
VLQQAGSALVGSALVGRAPRWKSTSLEEHLVGRPARNIEVPTEQLAIRQCRCRRWGSPKMKMQLIQRWRCIWAFGPQIPSWISWKPCPSCIELAQIIGATLLPHGRHIGQVEVWTKALYKVLWPNLQHLSFAIGQCLGFFGTGLVYKAPFNTWILRWPNLSHARGTLMPLQKEPQPSRLVYHNFLRYHVLS